MLLIERVVGDEVVGQDAGAECSTDATRTVQVTQTVRIDPGHSQVIEGDAGLRVVLTRR